MSAHATEVLRREEEQREHKREAYQKQREAHFQYEKLRAATMSGVQDMVLEEPPSHTITTTGPTTITTTTTTTMTKGSSSSSSSSSALLDAGFHGQA